MVSLNDFLLKVREIDAERPAYCAGGDGSDGTCDCIGLVIGALRRAGGKWTGTHGSNYAARYAVDALRRVSGAGDLRVGDIVFKKREPGETGWALPAAYARHPDQRDYYHAGVVLSVAPLDICHCTTPTTAHDSKTGRWTYAARLSALAGGEKEEGAMEALYQARVATDRDPLRVRESPREGRVLGHVPKGETVDVLCGGDWMRIRYGELTGYASAAYLERVGEAAQGVPQGASAVLMIIDGAGNRFLPTGGFRVLLGGED